MLWHHYMSALPVQRNRPQHVSVVMGELRSGLSKASCFPFKNHNSFFLSLVPKCILITPLDSPPAPNALPKSPQSFQLPWRCGIQQAYWNKADLGQVTCLDEKTVWEPPGVLCWKPGRISNEDSGESSKSSVWISFASTWWSWSCQKLQALSFSQ